MAWLYFVPSINTCPTSMPFVGFEHAVFSRRGIARFGISEIGELFYLKIAIPVGVDVDAYRPDCLRRPRFSQALME